MADVTEDGLRFLQELYNQCGGDAAATFSMFDIGANVGMERERAGAMAEELIGWGLVEVRTLSGGIAITDSGIETIRQMTGPKAQDPGEGVCLDEGPVLSDAACGAADRLVCRLKSGIDGLHLGFERLSEMMADLKGIEAQLSSPRPKTDVVRACFDSILGVLKTVHAQKETDDIRRLVRRS